MAELETNVGTETSQEVETETTAETTETTESAELARLKAEIAKQKAALDKATKEAAESKRALRAKQSAEEIAAEEAKTQQEALMKELETLRKEKAVAAMTAKAVPFIGNNDAAAELAEYLYGAEDADAALTAIQKAWTAREKALRLEYGKIPAPGAGGTDGPMITKEQLDAMKYVDRAKFASEHPDEYNRLMGR
ncbi:MAG: hypothetical protein J6S50_05155 [Oscillospiraceae bacterium]|nr:hypothetical protein [Oscillospiraceae bacterium]